MNFNIGWNNYMCTCIAYVCVCVQAHYITCNDY